MTAEPAGELPVTEVIQVRGEDAVAVPLAEYRRLRALERLAFPQELQEAEIEATLAAHQEWVTAGRPGARPHAEVRRILLGLDAG